MRKTLACSFNVEDVVPVLHSITKVDAPTWKATSIVQLARKQKVHKKVTIVFPKNYASKSIAGINIYRKSLPNIHEAGRMGVSIKKLGTFTEKDLIMMRDWHDESPKFDAFSGLAAWIRVSRFARITLPSPLNNCVTADLQACAKKSDREFKDYYGLKIRTGRYRRDGILQTIGVAGRFVHETCHEPPYGSRSRRAREELYWWCQPALRKSS